MRRRVLSSQQLTELWHSHAAALLLLARGRCSAPEDCVQEAFIRLATQEPVPDSPVAWLYRVVRNEAVSQVRSQERRRVREERVARARAVWFASPPGSPAESIGSEEIERALRQLSDDTRDIMVAAIWGEMTFQEIADAFGISKATAHRIHQRGLETLRRLLTGVEADHRTNPICPQSGHSS